MIYLDSPEYDVLLAKLSFSPVPDQTAACDAEPILVNRERADEEDFAANEDTKGEEGASKENL